MRFRNPRTIRRFERAYRPFAFEEAFQQMIGDALGVSLARPHANDMAFWKIGQAQAFLRKLATSFFSPLLWGLFIALALGEQAWGIVGILLILAIGLVLFLLVPVLSRNATSAGGADNALAGLSAFLAIVLAPLGLVVGIIALAQVRARGEYGRPLALAAIVLSLVVISIVGTLVALQTFGVINVLALLFP